MKKHNETKLTIYISQGTKELCKLNTFVRPDMSLRHRIRVQMDTLILNNYIAKGRMDSAGTYVLTTWKHNWHSVASTFEKID